MVPAPFRGDAERQAAEAEDGEHDDQQQRLRQDRDAAGDEGPQHAAMNPAPTTMAATGCSSAHVRSTRAAHVTG